MIKIWFKLINDDKIIESKIFTMQDILNTENFFALIQEACESFDIPTPVILSGHISDYVNFNHCVFKPRDFVEVFYHDKLVLENAI